MKKKLLAGLAVGMMMFGMAGVANANLITNGSFEDGLNNWSAINLNGDTTTSSTNAASVGTHSLELYQPNGSSYGSGWTAIGQDLTGKLDINKNYKLQVDYMMPASDGHQVYFVFSNYNYVMSGHGGDVMNLDSTPKDGQWHTAEALFGPDKMSSSFQSLFIMDDYGTHGPSTIYLDNIRLTEVAQTPIPGAVWLLGSGLAGLIGARRKKK